MSLHRVAAYGRLITIAAMFSSLFASSALGAMHPDMIHLPDYTADASHPTTMVMGNQTLSVPSEAYTIVVMGNLTVDTDLRVVNLIVMEGGSLTLTARATVTIRNEPLDTTFDPDQFGH